MAPKQRKALYRLPNRLPEDSLAKTRAVLHARLFALGTLCGASTSYASYMVKIRE